MGGIAAVRTAIVAIILLASPHAVLAQPARKPVRIGMLGGETLFVEHFAQAVRELGYADYRDFILDRRYVSGEAAPELSRFAAELVQVRADVIVTDTTAAALAVKRETSTIPVVVVAEDPVGSGLVASLARPGGNITGLSTLSPELGVKRLQLLKETAPRASRVAVLWTTAHTVSAIGVREMEGAAHKMGIRLSPLGAHPSIEYEEALVKAIREGADTLIMLGGDPVFLPHEARRVLALAARHRLPTIYDRREYADFGGLMAFGPSVPALARRAAAFVDRILKGAKPADLPVEQPTTFELVVNLKTAKTLGLTVPSSVLARADAIIE
jgi:putative ABC transport system substrate-binding protein